MKLYIITSLLSLLVAAPPHDIPLGIFSLTFEDGQIQMDIKLEVEDIEKAVGLYYQQKSNDRLVEQYVLKHTEWYINDTQLIPELCSTDIIEGHYLLKMNFIAPSLPLTSMTIENKCLLQEIKNHSNIIYVHQNGQRRGFRLHKERQQTTFELQ